MPGARMDYAVELGQARCQIALADKNQNTCTISALGCWEFTGSVNTDGYGQIFLKKNSNLHLTGRSSQTAFLLHIVAFVAANGHHPVAHCSHLCDNRRCFNPAHLTDESATLNNSRKGCWGDILCPDHGHILVQFCGHQPKCIRHNLTAEHVQCCLTLRQIAEEHSSQPELLSAFGSSRPSSSGQGGMGPESQ